MVSVVGRAVCGRRCRFGSRICRFDCPGRGAFIRNVPKRLFGSGCLAFCSHGCSLLLTMCKNRHVPRICKINSTNSAFFITNTRRAALRRTGFSSLRMSFRSREMACAPFFRGAGGALIKEPPCNRREVGGEGRGAFRVCYRWISIPTRSRLRTVCCFHSRRKMHHSNPRNTIS